jgi:hypothetical protein
MVRYALGHGTVTALLLGGRPVSWNVPNRSRPVVKNSARRAVLGGTAGDGQIAVPLDAELGFDRESCDSLPKIHEHAIVFALGGELTGDPVNVPIGVKRERGDIGQRRSVREGSGIQGASGSRAPSHTTRKPKERSRLRGGLQ